jgi:hypothetical protein
MSQQAAELALKLLRASLPLWGIEGVVVGPADSADEPGSAAVGEVGEVGEVGGDRAALVAIVRTAAQVEVRIEAALAQDAPVRWWVRSRADAQAAPRSRPCTSAVGLLRSVRDALDVAPGMRVAIAPRTGGAA